MKALRQRQEWKFFSVLPKVAPGLAFAWWALVGLRGLLPAVFAIAMGVLVGAVQHKQSLGESLALVGAVFVLLQILTPIHTAVGANLGDRTAAWLYDRLTEACGRPQGMGHLEDAKLTNDLSMARDFDLGITAPPMSTSLDFIASGLVQMVGGISLAIVLIGYAWWAAALLAGAWLATHWLLRESSVWRDRNTDEVRSAQRESEYLYRLAVRRRGKGDAPIRSGGLDPGAVSDPTEASLSTAVPRHAPASEIGAVEPAFGRQRQRHRILVARQRGP